MTPRHMGAEGYLVSPAVFKTVGDGVPVLVCSIRTGTAFPSWCVRFAPALAIFKIKEEAPWNFRASPDGCGPRMRKAS